MSNQILKYIFKQDISYFRYFQNAGSSAPKQQRLLFGSNNRDNVKPINLKEATELVARYLVGDMLPLSTVGSK
ncbi:hypothetical protein P3454_25850 [Vibrio parahaemolyticus]|nr:hypothetical protein [Vibrio parahaemolyticus]